MPVGIILIGFQREAGGLHASLCVDGLRLAVLLAHKAREREFAELKFSLQAKQRSASPYKARTRGHAHIAGLNILYNFILFSLIIQFEVLRIEIERSVGVVTHVEFKFITD